MRRHRKHSPVVLVVAWVLVIAGGGCSRDLDIEPPPPFPELEHHGAPERALALGSAVARAATPDGRPEKMPPLTERMTPCNSCHDEVPANATPRELTVEHTDIRLEHGGLGGWCGACHDLNNKEKLHLANTESVDFDQRYRICGQCHGGIYRDWVAGIHGKRVGNWNGDKIYKPCANCHRAHSPGRPGVWDAEKSRWMAIQPFRPKPPPRRPTEIR